VQHLGHLFFVALGVKSQQPSEHVVADGIGPAVAPGKFLLALYGAVGAQRGLEGAGFIGLPEEQLIVSSRRCQCF
jgi:hypothetical protein